MHHKGTLRRGVWRQTFDLMYMALDAIWDDSDEGQVVVVSGLHLVLGRHLVLDPPRVRQFYAIQVLVMAGLNLLFMRVA